MKGGPGKEAGSNQHLRLYLTTALIVSHQGDKILLFLEGSGSSTRFRWIKATTYNELNQLSYTIAHRLAQYLERQGLMATKHDYLAIADLKVWSCDLFQWPCNQIACSSITAIATAYSPA
jgi:hypothetical protein